MSDRSPVPHALKTLVAPCLALATLLAPGRAAAEPSLLVPARRDSAGVVVESPPAPLLFPGRPQPGDTTHKASPAQEAREKVALGLALERDDKPASAIVAYQTAIGLDPTVPEAYYRIGLLFLGVNQIAAAANSFAAELKHHPGHTDAGRQLGITLTRLGEIPRAVAQLRLLTRRNPRDHRSWAALGAAYARGGRAADAEAALRRAVRLVPGSSEYHRDLGVVLAASGRGDAARDEYARAQRLDPRDAAAWLDLGNLERRERRFDRALAAYHEAEKRDSNLVLALQGQCESLRDLHRELEAADVYRRWLRAHPTDHQARLEAVRLLAGVGRRDAALELARDGVRADPGAGDAHLVLGMALHWSGDPRGGLAEMRRAVEQFSDAAGRARARAVIASVRAAAPDSLRGFYAADSAAHEGAGPAARPTPRP